MNYFQALGQLAVTAAVLILALWGIGITGAWLWQWTGRCAERLERKAGRPVHGLAQRLADGRAVR